MHIGNPQPSRRSLWRLLGARVSFLLLPVTLLPGSAARHGIWKHEGSLRNALCAAFLFATLTSPALAQSPPNASAILSRFPLPGLDDGFVPQGLTVTGGDILLGGYLWPLPGPQACRVYRLSPAGETKASRDIDAPCSHAGGLASASGRLFIADTKRLIELDAQKLDTKRVWPLAKPLVGSFLAGRDGEIWIGDYLTRGEAKIYRIRLADLDKAEKTLAASAASATLPIPHKTQGAAFAPDGSLWLSQSGQTFGSITHHDGATGTLLATYPAPTGIEDIGFDAAGLLWASSETGSRRWNKAKAPFPFVYSIDTRKLRP